MPASFTPQHLDYLADALSLFHDPARRPVLTRQGVMPAETASRPMRDGNKKSN